MKKAADKENLHIHFLLHRSLSGWGIHAFLYDAGDRLTASTRKQGDCPKKDIVEEVRKICIKNKMPSICHLSDTVFVMGFTEPDTGRLWLFGPVSSRHLSENEIMQYQLHHFHKDSSMGIPYVMTENAVSCLATVCALVTGQEFPENKIMKKTGAISAPIVKDHAVSDFQSEQQGVSLNTYRDELDFVREISEGNMKIDEGTILKGQWMMEKIGDRGAVSFQKWCEYAFVMSFALVRDAAIQNGVSPQTAFSLIDSGLQQMASCRTDVQQIHVYANIINEMERKIREEKSRVHRGNLSERCKDYIGLHLKEALTVKEIAAALGVTASYLSRIFSAAEGIPVSDYIAGERLKLGANLLKNSRESVGTISDYLHYPSQSYFTRKFKEHYGMTPLEYRRRNSLEFIR